MNQSVFSRDYFHARERFRDACRQIGWPVTSLPISCGQGLLTQAQREPLTIDVAHYGDGEAASTVVISSGVHGVEGFFGAAVQLAMLTALQAGELAIAKERRVVLIHAVNPWGFAMRRRWNEDGVDLNRNFLRVGEAYAGSPPLYSQIDAWLNPPSPPIRGLSLPPRAIVDLARRGSKTLMQTIPVGQYDFPQGLFYGGSGPAESTQIVQRHLGEWIGDAREVTHLDFHTGLGPFATHKLLLDVPSDDADAAWFRTRFGEQVISALPAGAGGEQNTKVYAARGAFGTWCMSRFADRRYRFATAEFGTYGPLAVLLALRQENRAHHWGDGKPGCYDWAKRRLVEVFIPESPKWRERVVADGLRLILTALRS